MPPSRNNNGNSASNPILGASYPLSQASATSNTMVASTDPKSSGAESNNSNSELPAGCANSSAVVYNLFGPSVGPCFGDFSTNYCRVNGRLYAVTSALYFYSNLFGFERRLCMPFGEIVQMESFRNTSIRISMMDCEDHVFRKIRNRDAVLEQLKDLYRKYLESNSFCNNVRRLSFPGSVDTSCIVRSADICLESACRPRADSELTAEVFEAKPLVADTAVTRPDRPRSHSVPCMAGDPAAADTNSPTSNNSRFPLRRFNTTIFSSRRELKRQGSSSSEITATANPPTVVAATTAVVANDDVSSPSSAQPDSVPKDFDMEQAWAEAKQSLGETSLEEITLNCSLDQFMNMFFSDGASFPIFKYQEETIGDKDMQVTEWKDREPSPYPSIRDRSINYIHPLKNAVGPNEAQTTREQSLQRFGDLGFCLQNVTQVKGVPAADCFQVEDRWVIECVDNGTCKFSVSFRIVFHKRSMFKTIITKNIRQESKSFIQGYARYVQEALASGSPQNGQNPTMVTPPPTPVDHLKEDKLVAMSEKAMTERRRYLSFDLFGKKIALILLLSMVAQLVFLQRSVRSMEFQMMQLQQQNQELIEAVAELSEQQCQNIERHPQ